MALALFINNKHGTLIFQKDFSELTSQLSANDKIILASTFHGISGIAAQLTPEQVAPVSSLGFMRPRGITTIKAAKFKLHCFNTPTGLKYFVVTSPSLASSAAETLCKKSYELFCDYVLKNPFHDIEMPVRCPAFDREIRKLFSEYIADSDNLL